MDEVHGLFSCEEGLAPGFKVSEGKEPSSGGTRQAPPEPGAPSSVLERPWIKSMVFLGFQNLLCLKISWFFVGGFWVSEGTDPVLRHAESWIKEQHDTISSG